MHLKGLDVLYERTQRGYFFSALLIAGAFLEVWVITVTTSANDMTSLWINAPIFIALIASAAIFSSMTIRISNDRLDWWLGFRTFHRVVFIADIARCAPHRVPLIAGLGIKTNDFKSWLILIDGRTAVAMVLRSGSTLMLGTPEPERVCSVIASARGSG